MYLKRYHDVSVSPSGIWRILKRANLNCLPASQRYKRHTERWKRYEKQQPGHAVQIDVKFIEPIKGVRKKHYQYSAIDDCTRLRVLRIYERRARIGVRAFVKYSNRLIARIDRPSGTNGLAPVLARARVGPSGRLVTIPKARGPRRSSSRPRTR